ncbi:hypothetical protein [Terriglobus sp.]|uniref:hypothetical protein n=1 Tax=Terriglobus sp. TaxID=1889013 RepID=UPI003AFFA67F
MTSSHRSFAKAVFAAGTLAASAVLYAAAPAASSQPSTDIAQLNRSLLTPGAYSLADVNADLRYRTDGVSSSSDAVDDEVASLSASPADVAEGSGAGAGQYGSHRRRYGRSRYQDRLHNSDGSTKIAFLGGAGLNVPVGNTGKFYTPSYDIEVGGGWNFNQNFGVLAEFHYDHVGLSGGAINSEYNNLLAAGVTADELDGFDANGHVLSFSIDPVISLTQSHSKLGAYVTGGVGYYRKTTNFTLPSIGTTCDYYYCYQYSSNVNVDQYTASGFGANAGLGLTYKLSEFSSERLFVEARYHWLKLNDNNNQDFFQFNRRNSEYIPVTVGIRF